MRQIMRQITKKRGARGDWLNSAEARTEPDAAWFVQVYEGSNLAMLRRGPHYEAYQMTMKKTIVLLGVTTAMLAGCVSPIAPTTEENRRTQTGAVTGALIGGAIGATSKGSDRFAKAAVGAGIGALIGGAIGSSLDAQAAELRNSIGNDGVSVTNTGSELIVNLPQDILFATGSANLRSDLTRDIQAVARSLINYPNTTVQVIGHTDNVGSAALNQDLSQRRAASVASILRSNGVPGARIVAFGRGEDQPVASNLSDAGRAQNRRVEIVIRPN